MQMKTSIKTFALAALVTTSVPAVTNTGNVAKYTCNISEYCTPSKIGNLIINHPWLTGCGLFGTYTLYGYYDRQPTTDPSRFNLEELKAKLEGKSILEQFEILTEYMWYYFKDEFQGHDESKSTGKADGNGKVIYGEAIPGRGYIYAVHRHKTAVIKTLCAPLVVALMIALLDRDIEAFKEYQKSGLGAGVTAALKIPKNLDAKILAGKA